MCRPSASTQVLTVDGLAGLERTIAPQPPAARRADVLAVNSTARGGGVAEMLQSLIGYVRRTGVDDAGP